MSIKNIADDFVGSSAVGAYPNGTRIVKCNSEKGDTFEDGTYGTVVGSVSVDPPVIANGIPIKYGYIIKWDPLPDLNIFIVELRICPVVAG